MEISKFKKQSIYGSEYYCYGPTMLDGVKDYYLNQYDNFQKTSKDYSLISKNETPDFRSCNICNITAMIMCLKLMNIELPRIPDYNKNNVFLSRAEERLAQFMYSKGIEDPTQAKDLVIGTNLWLKKDIAKELTETRNGMKKAIEDLLYGLPVLTSGYFFNAKEKGGKFERYFRFGADGRYINSTDENGKAINGIQGHYVCISAVAFESEYKEGEEPVYYQIQDPYGKTFSSATQQYPYNTVAETKGTTGKDVWLTKEQFKFVFSPRKDKNTHRVIRFTKNTAVLDEKWSEFLNIKTLPDLLNNYNTKGWFSKNAVTSYMYSSGYEKIKGKYPGLVKIFDSGREVEGYSSIEVKPEAGLNGNKLFIDERENHFIDNLAPRNAERAADAFNISGDKLRKFFAEKNYKRYFVGDYGHTELMSAENTIIPIASGPIATLLRYPEIKSNNTEESKNKIMKFFSNFIINGEGYLIGGGKILYSAQGGFNCGEIDQKLPELKGNDGYINLKKLFAIAGFFDGASFGAKRDNWLSDEDKRFLNNFKESDLYSEYRYCKAPFSLDLFATLNQYSKRNIMPVYENHLDNHKFVKKINDYFKFNENERRWLAIFSAIIHANSGGTGFQSEYGVAKEKVPMNLKFIENREYWPVSDEEYGELNNAIKRINEGEPFFGIMNDYIYYLESGDKNTYPSYEVPIKNFSNRNSSDNVVAGITEIATPITEGEIFKKPEKYIFEGIRIYFKKTLGRYGVDDDYKEWSIPFFGTFNYNKETNTKVKNFDIYLKNKLGELDGTEESIKELCFFFRYMGEGENYKKLYRYTISLEKYENVVNTDANGKKALYFIPFICDLDKLNANLKNFLFEAYYGGLVNGKQLQLGNITDKEEYKPAIVKTYLQFGKFNNDILNISRISNKPVRGFQSLEERTPSEDIKGPYGVEYCIYNTTSEKGADASGEIPYGFDKELTAKDLEDVVVGCFSLNPPEVKGEDGWASSGDSNAKPVLLDSITKTAENGKDIYKYTLKVIEKKENGDKVKHNFGKVSPGDIKKLVNLNKKTLKINKFEYYTGYGAGEELVDYPEDPIDYGSASISVGTPYNAGQKLFTMELQYGFNTNKEKLYPNKENLTDEEKKEIVWEPDSVSCKVSGSQIVSLGSNDEIVASGEERGEKGKPLLFERVTESMINKSANLLGERISLMNVNSAEDCNMYINDLGYLVHGYGLSYSLACITDDNTMKKEFEKCIENNKNNLFKVGKEYAVIEKPKKDLASMNTYEQKAYQNTINEKSKKLGGYIEKAYVQNKLVERNVISGYGVSVSEAKKVLGKYISDISLGKVITCLKLWQMALEGETNFSEEAAEKKYSQNISLFEEKTMGKLNQEAYEDLVAVSIFNEDFEAMQRGLFKEILDEVNGAKLTDEQKKETFEICFKRYLNGRAYSDFNKYKLNNFKVKDFLKKEINNFNIIMSSNKVKPNGNLTSKKLTIELTCTAVTGGFLDSVIGGGFNKLAKKE